MQERTVQSGSARLAVREAGEGMPMAALHAGVADQRAWDAVRPAWADADHRVLTYDRRGFGASSWEAEPHSTLADLWAVMGACEVEQGVLVGNSMGGGLALNAALDQPHRVSALVLIAPAVSGAQFPDPPGPWVCEAEQALEAQLMAAEEVGDIDLLNRLELHYWLDGPEQPEGRVSGPARDLVASMNRRALEAPAVGPAQKAPPVWDRLSEITVPTLCIVGAHDERISRYLAQHAAERVPDASYVEIPGTAHLPMVDQPDALNDVILPFLARL